MNRQAARAAGVVEAAAVFLFFFQSLRVLFSTLFGMIYDALFAEIVPMTVIGLVLVAVLLALLTPLTSPKKNTTRHTVTLIAAILVFLARIAMTFNKPDLRLVASLVILAASGPYLVARVRLVPQRLYRAILLALAADQILRAAGLTFDVSLRETWWPGQVLVSLGLCLLTLWLSRRSLKEEVAAEATPGLLGGVAWGAWLFLEASLLAFPNAISRWSNVSSPQESAVVTALLLGTTLAPLLLKNRGPGSRVAAYGGTALLLTALAAGYLLSGPVAVLMLLLAQWLALKLPTTYVESGPGPSRRRLETSMVVGGVLFLVLSFGYAFTFTYAYTLDLFRNMGLPIFLAAGLLAAIPSLRLRTARQPQQCTAYLPRALAWGLGIATVLAVGVLAWPQTQRQPPGEGPIRAATYNIHYGYDTFWHLNLEDQAQTIEASGADIVALQEVDTARPTSYMIDNALWLAHRLGMEAVYLPSIEHLTGIALLSRYPILDSDLWLLPSELEQTGLIWAKLDVGGAPVNAFSIWMGLEPDERARQADAALEHVAAHPGPAVFGGDFNSGPESPVYRRIENTGFVDPFLALGLGSPPTDPGIIPTKRIDFVWLRDLTPVHAIVPESTASDHRMVIVEGALPYPRYGADTETP